MKDSYLTAGIKLERLLRLLGRNSVEWRFRNVARIAFLLQSGAWSSFFSWFEAARYGRAIGRAPVPTDPVFIIGHWRTGTTLLHQLMALDPALSAPPLFQEAVPASFLVSYPYYRPLFKRVVSERRPMDEVRIGMDEPQEDEYAIYRITSYSPLERLVFPDSGSYFLNHGRDFLPRGEELNRWKAGVGRYYKKLAFKTGKRIVSKNPFNSFRIGTLREIFPSAKFIYMVRHPYDVVPSTIHMWRILQEQNTLGRLSPPPETGEVTGLYRLLDETVGRDTAELPTGDITKVRYEDLVRSPGETLKETYHAIGLPFDERMPELIRRFTENNASYRKNSFSLSARDQELIAAGLESLMTREGYAPDMPTTPGS